MITGCFSYKNFEEVYIGVEGDRVGLCNGLWDVYMLYLFKADKHSEQRGIFRHTDHEKAMPRT